MNNRQMTKWEWEDWLFRFRSPLKNWQREQLDSSVELNLAVSDGNYRDAEQIAHSIAFGANRQQGKMNRLLNELLD